MRAVSSWGAGRGGGGWVSSPPMSPAVLHEEEVEEAPAQFGEGQA